MTIPAPPKLEVVGYELETRPYDGLWSRFEGRVIRLLRYEGSEGVHRDHFLPDYGPASDGRTWVTSRPYWLRARSRERLKTKLCDMLNKHVEAKRREQPERIELTDTMAGWQ